jgi:2-oxo-4-hydroxy-4-carboxy-5-ureidoimidazoline decarboxylase
MNLAQINAGSDDEARQAFLRCCGSSRWAGEMARLRPFDSEDSLFVAGERIWNSLDRPDRLEAFAAHPKIGDLAALRAKFATTAAWAAAEQGGVAGAGEHVIRDLAELNVLYEQRFGYIFIVCATGKSAEEMLDLLRRRLSHIPSQEIEVAADEQWKITRIRLEKLAP